MKKLIILLILTMSTLQLKAGESVVGYLAYWNKFDPQKLELLTDLIVFSAQPKADGSLQVSDALHTSLEKINKQRPENKKVFLCIGGWGRSKHFPIVTKDPKLRKKFIAEVMQLIKKYKLDGVDYDWEHPKNLKEYGDYATLIRETKDAGTLVSIAAGSGQKFPKDFFKHLYRVNLMTYDMPGKHSTLTASRKEVEKLIKMGCPAEKICMGVPFYGRHITSRNKTRSSAKLAEKAKDETVDEIDGFYFNNVSTLKKKAVLAKELKINGIMIWEIESDTKDKRLLKTLHEVLKN